MSGFQLKIKYTNFFILITHPIISSELKLYTKADEIY